MEKVSTGIDLYDLMEDSIYEAEVKCFEEYYGNAMKNGIDKKELAKIMAEIIPFLDNFKKHFYESIDIRLSVISEVYEEDKEKEENILA